MICKFNATQGLRIMYIGCWGLVAGRVPGPENQDGLKGDYISA